MYNWELRIGQVAGEGGGGGGGGESRINLIAPQVRKENKKIKTLKNNT